jgi:hypothetical protein
MFPLLRTGRDPDTIEQILIGPRLEMGDPSGDSCAMSLWTLHFRAICWNLLNPANLRPPENGLESPAFGQILEGRLTRPLQLAVKVVF